MVQYKLSYFGLRGRAEFIRYIFAFSGVDFEDDRIDFTTEGEWAKRKLEMPLGQVPMLTVDGTQLAESVAIGDYLARKYNLCGEGDLEAAQCVMLASGVADAMRLMRPYVIEMLLKQDKEKADEEYKNAKPELQKHFAYYEALLKKNGGDWFVGKKPTWADLKIGEFNQRLVDCVDETVLEGFDGLKAHASRVHQLEAIKKYCDARKFTPY